MKAQIKIQEKWLLYQVIEKKDPEAYGKLYDLLSERIYRFIYFKVSSSVDAEDLTADVFLKAWQHINEGKEVRNFSGLLYTIARNNVIDLYRRRSNQPEESIDEILLNKLSDAGTAVTELEKTHEATLMIQRLKQLKNEYREALTLRYVDELSMGEISAILGKSNVSSRVLVHRALNALRKIIEKENVQPGTQK
jgi:RNA polymerase sigma-70 factor (ECF subfamily)